MGYYTRFDLKINVYNKITGEIGLEIENYYDEYKDIIKMLQEKSGYEYLFDESIKWYEHDDDMIYISKKFPLLLFTLSGEGEEAGDLWKTYYLGGWSQDAKAVITYEPFDIDKLT